MGRFYLARGPAPPPSAGPHLRPKDNSNSFTRFGLMRFSSARGKRWTIPFHILFAVAGRAGYLYNRWFVQQGRSSVVEQRPFKPKVVGSIPTAPTKIFNVYADLIRASQGGRTNRTQDRTKKVSPSSSISRV